MLIVGCDFHPSWQQIAWLDAETQIREATNAKINPILTPEQQEKLQAMRAQHRDEMMQKPQ